MSTQDGAALTQSESIEVRDMLAEARDLAERSLDHLVDCLDELGVSSRVYARRHRIKRIEAIEEKITRKRTDPDRQGAQYNWSDITDIIGIRFITLYRGDIAPVAEIVLRALLNDVAEVKPCPFERSELIEFKYFLANALAIEDEVAAKLSQLSEAYWRSSDKWEYKKPIPSNRYSSIHFVTRVKSKSGKKVPVEVQVRSVFEDAWGEVDHALLYEQTRSKVRLPAHIKAYSNALKKMMDAAADFADVMRTVATPPKAPVAEIRPTLDDASYVQEVCRRIGMGAAHYEPLMEIILRKERLDSARKNGHQTSSDYLIIVAQLEEFLARQLEPAGFLFNVSAGDPRRQLIYVLTVERAVCRLLSQGQQQPQRAAKLLSELSKEFPDHPVIWLRLGEACAAQLETADTAQAQQKAATQGLNAYKSAAEKARNLPALSGDARFFAASDVQESYIRDNLGRLHAFLVWRIASRRRGDLPPTRTSLTAARAACQLTHDALPQIVDEGARQKTLNSLIYFAAEVLSFSAVLNEAHKLPFGIEALKAYVIEVEKFVPSDLADKGALPMWDSLAFVLEGLAILEDRESGGGAPRGGKKTGAGETWEKARTAAGKVLNAVQIEMKSSGAQAAPTYIVEQRAAATERALRILGLRT